MAETKDERAERLAQALRENLRRRKARDRAVADVIGNEECPSPSGEG